MNPRKSPKSVPTQCEHFLSTTQIQEFFATRGDEVIRGGFEAHVIEGRQKNGDQAEEAVITVLYRID